MNCGYFWVFWRIFSGKLVYHYPPWPTLLKSLKRFWPYLIVFSVSRKVSLSNYCIWCLFFISNLMRSSVVYAAIWFMHVCKIWDNDLTESDRVSGLIISLWNFKKPLDIFSPQIERKRSKEYLVIILAVKESFERFSCLSWPRVHLWKK